MNFGERIEWWGLLVDGFDRCPNYAMPYTHSYYVKFFEEYGFRDFFKQYTYRNKLVMESLAPVVVWKADRLLKNPDYSVYTYREIGKQKAIDSLLEVMPSTPCTSRFHALLYTSSKESIAFCLPISR